MTKAKPLALVGIVMVIAFFGPWIDVLGRVKLSGWALAHEPMLGWKRHVLWAYPAGGAALALAAWRGAASARTLALALGVFVVGLALYRTFDGLVASLRYGAWLTIARIWDSKASSRVVTSVSVYDVIDCPNSSSPFQTSLSARSCSSPGSPCTDRTSWCAIAAVMQR